MFFKKNDEKEELKNLLVQNRRKEKVKKEKDNVKWIVQIAQISFTISFGLSFVSEIAIPNLSVLWGILLTLAFVFVGILFDIVGVAVTGADEKVFHSMNSRQVKGSKVAVLFKKNADKVSSFCCDVIGDICGIVSGASASAVSVGLAATFNWNLLLVSLTVAAVVASLTIGGKACGKSFAINKSDVILYEFAKIISIFYRK